MLHTDAGLLAGAVALGAVHGVEPGHGWPVAAAYALDRTNRWVYGFLAGTIIGVGHLVSSIAMVLVFFSAKSYFDLTQIDEPIAILGGVRIGGPVSLVAGLLLVALGIREYRHGHSHGENGHGIAAERHAAAGRRDDSHRERHRHRDEPHDHDHSHDHDHHGAEGGHPHTHGQTDHGVRARLGSVLPFVGSHSHTHAVSQDAADRGLVGIAWFAFVLGFAHEEEFEILALCAGSSRCLQLMSAYALAVVAGILGLTMLLIAGYTHSEAAVARYTPYLPAVSAAVLVVMGVGFITGLL